MTSSNTTESLHKNWINVIIEDVVKHRKEKAMPDQLPNAKFIGMDCIAPNATKPSFFYDFSDYKSAGNVFRYGDVLYGRLRPYLNKVYKAEIEGVCSGEFIVLIPSSIIFSKYLLYTLHSKKFVDFANLHVTGERPRISFNKISKYCINLPPHPEQRAIVAKIELLFSDLDNGIANLKKAQEQLKIYRQAVLKKAFEGELTRKWREEQTDLTSAEELLLRIKEEREKHYQKQLDEWKKAVKEWEDNGKVGKKPSRPKKPKEMPPLSEGELKELQELPDGWKKEKINNLTFLITDGKHGDCQNEDKSGFYFISVKDITDGKINYQNARQITKSDFLEVHKRTDLKQNDVLITNSGTIGRVAIAAENEKTQKTTFQKSVAIIKKPDKLIDSKYLAYHLQNDVELIKLVSKGTAQKNLLLRDIKEIVIFIIPIQEQHQIVREIETRISICDKLEATIAESLQKSDALRQSILKRVFEGKLLNEKELEEARNAPDWEPADKLLERIKAEKEKQGTKKSFWGTPSE